MDLAAIAGELLDAGQDLREPTLVTTPLHASAVDSILGYSRSEVLETATVAWRAPGGADVFGFGSALSVTGPPDCSFETALPAMRRWLATSRSSGVPHEARTRLFAGARFAPSGGSKHSPWDTFGGWGFGAPVFLVTSDEDQSSGSASLVLHPGAEREEIVHRLDKALHPSPQRRHVQGKWPQEDASPERWQMMVEEALREIEAIKYRKVVLARSRTLTLNAPVESGRVLDRLGSQYPGCFLFKWTSGESTFLGATPELLCRVKNGRIETASLAGSRHRGSTPERDEELRQELLGDKKERSEHAIVTESILARIAGIAENVQAPREPDVAQLANIQHLFTPIQAMPAGGRDILDFVVALHPTPAVGGHPSSEALDAIARIERLDRGWYAGPIGWVDAAGNGEFAVALRSAVLSGSTAMLFAGAGIVEGSDPSREWTETDLKLRPLTEAILG